MSNTSVSSTVPAEAVSYAIVTSFLAFRQPDNIDLDVAMNTVPFGLYTLLSKGCSFFSFLSLTAPFCQYSYHIGVIVMALFWAAYAQSFDTISASRRAGFYLGCSLDIFCNDLCVLHFSAL